MKVYVLTHCAAEENYTPEVFMSKEKAEEALKEYYEDNTQDDEVIFEQDYETDWANIIYNDDTYDVFQIFEVEVQD